jgi:hypothetical protein
VQVQRRESAVQTHLWNKHVYMAAQLCVQCTILSTHVRNHQRPAFSVASTVCLLACTVCCLCSRCAAFSELYAVMSLNMLAKLFIVSYAASNHI